MTRKSQEVEVEDVTPKRITEDPRGSLLVILINFVILQLKEGDFS